MKSFLAARDIFFSSATVFTYNNSLLVMVCLSFGISIGNYNIKRTKLQGSFGTTIYF